MDFKWRRKNKLKEIERGNIDVKLQKDIGRLNINVKLHKDILNRRMEYEAYVPSSRSEAGMQPITSPV